MTTSGLIFMGVSWAAILGLAAACMAALFQAEGKSGPGERQVPDRKHRKGA